MVPIRRILRPPDARLLVAAFTVSGVVHLVRPRIFEAIVPAFLPRRRELVYASGVAELVCAVGLVRRAAWAGPATAAVLLGVWPANVSMAVVSSMEHRSGLRQVVLWLRVPLQIPLVRAALAARPRP